MAPTRLVVARLRVADTASRGSAEGGDTASRGSAEGGDTASRGSAEGGDTASRGSAEGGDTASRGSAEGGDTASRGSAEGGDTASRGSAEGGDTASRGSAEGGMVHVEVVEVAGLCDEGLSLRLKVLGRAESQLAAMKAQVLAEVSRRHSALAWIHRRGEACGVGASTRKAS